MPIAAPLIIGGATLASGFLGANAANKASERQYEAANNALAAQNAARAKLDPWVNVGSGANTTLGAMYGIGPDGSSVPQNADFSQFYNSPDFKFAQEQGNLGVDRALNARGMSLSGGALKDIAQFNQGLATQQFGNYYNRLMSLSQMGQSAAGAAMGGANSAANTMMSAGQAQASGIVGGANAITGGINNALGNTLMYQNIQNQQQQNSLLNQAMNRSVYANPGQPMNISPGTIGGTGGWW